MRSVESVVGTRRSVDISIWPKVTAGRRGTVSDLPDWARKSAALYSSCVAGAISEDAYVAGLRKAGLVNAEVKDRLVYDESQLVGFAESEVSQASCCGTTVPKEMVSQIAGALTGKIWSARIFAEKPQHA